MELDDSKRGLLTLEEDRSRGRHILKELEARQRSWEDLTLEEQRGPLMLALMERSISRANALRFSNPAEMVALTRSACGLSEGLSDKRYGECLANDLRARAWAEYGNALRVADELPQAGEALARACVLAGRGHGDFELAARIGELMASFLTDNRRFDEAAALLQDLAKAWFDRGKPGPVIKALVQLGHVWTQASQPRHAIAAHAQVLNHLRPGDPLYLPVLHTLALNFLEIGRADVADTMIQKFRGLYRHKGKLNEYRLFWLEGKIAYGLGDWRKAEGKLQTARLAFQRQGKSFDAALVSLDLALLFAQQERRKELSWLVQQMLQTFRSLGIARETLATLTLLRRCCEEGRSVELMVGQIQALMLIMPELRPRAAQR